jgi:hypothetical protein
MQPIIVKSDGEDIVLVNGIHDAYLMLPVPIFALDDV